MTPISDVANLAGTPVPAMLTYMSDVDERVEPHLNELVDVGGNDPPIEPSNGLDRAMRSVHRMMHQCTKLEEDDVRLKLGDQGNIHYINPDLDFPVQSFNFTPDMIRQIMADACAKTLAWLDEAHPD